MYRVCVPSGVGSFATPWTVSHQVPLSMGFSRQEYWSGLPLPTPGDLPDPGIKPTSLVSPALAGSVFAISSTWEDSQIYRREGNTGGKRKLPLDAAKMMQGMVPISLGIFHCFPSPSQPPGQVGQKEGLPWTPPISDPSSFLQVSSPALPRFC